MECNGGLEGLDQGGRAVECNGGLEGLDQGGRAVVLACSAFASSSADGTVRLWSLAWRCLAVLTIPSPTPCSNPHPHYHHHHSQLHPVLQPFPRSESHERLSSLHHHLTDPVASTTDSHPSLHHHYYDHEGHQHSFSEPPAAALCSAMGHKFVIAGCEDGQVHIWRLKEDIAVTALRAVASGD